MTVDESILRPGDQKETTAKYSMASHCCLSFCGPGIDPLIVIALINSKSDHYEKQKTSPDELRFKCSGSVQPFSDAPAHVLPHRGVPLLTKGASRRLTAHMMEIHQD